MSVLVTGGAGFIGSVTAKVLAEAGHPIAVLDNLSTGTRERARWGNVHIADVRSTGTLRDILREEKVSTVVHLAASSSAGDSVHAPSEYFSNNVAGTLTLLDLMIETGVRQLLFASSCSVYGNKAGDRLLESEDVEPVSPYGESKRMVEAALDWYGRAYGLRSVCLRYFNVAGADAAERLGEDCGRSSRLIPRAVEAALGHGGPLKLFGNRLNTPDGTAVRDFVHVCDVAHANLLAVRYLEQGLPSVTLNIGSGTARSVYNVIREVELTLGCRVPVRHEAPRPGDPPSAVADCSAAAEVLGWRPRHSSLPEIVSSAAGHHRNLCCQIAGRR